MPDNPVLYMAGFYRRFPEGDKVKDSYPRFVILTTDGTVNDTMKDIHSRMPVVLRPHECEGWLNSEADLAKLSDRSQLHMDCRPA